MKKELIITFSYYGIGGAQRRAFALADSFAKKGYNVYVLAVLGSDSTINEENYYNVDKNVKLILIPEYYENNKSNKNIVESDKTINKKIVFLKKLQSLFKHFKKNNKKNQFSYQRIKKKLCIKKFYDFSSGFNRHSFWI